MGQKFPQQFGPYTLHELIARGGMAEVYRATMPGIGGFEKMVAIKKILPHLAEDEEFITMLIDEARIIVSINHSNIAQVYDLGKLDDTYYIAMEYVHGVDVSTVIKELDSSDQRVPFAHLVYIAAGVCSGLHCAHSQVDDTGEPLNIVHRDLSPHNVLVSFAGDVKIIDFGVAKASVKQAHTRMGVIKGKLLYMAPEQAMAKDLDGRADLFAVGLMLYKSLTGRLPFEGTNEFQIYNNILSKEIEPPQELNPDIPDELNRIVMKFLERERDDRYPDGYTAKQDLDRVLHQIAPGYTVSRLSRFIEENFSHLVRSKTETQQNPQVGRSADELSVPDQDVPSLQIDASDSLEQLKDIEESDDTVNLSNDFLIKELQKDWHEKADASRRFTAPKPSSPGINVSYEDDPGDPDATAEQDSLMMLDDLEGTAEHSREDLMAELRQQRSYARGRHSSSSQQVVQPQEVMESRRGRHRAEGSDASFTGEHSLFDIDEDGTTSASPRIPVVYIAIGVAVSVIVALLIVSILTG